MRPFLVRDGERLMRVGAATDRGRRRQLNEDAVLAKPSLGVFLVADGVGGENAGEIASSMVALSVCNFFEVTGKSDYPDSYRALLDLTLATAARRLCAAIRKANADVHEMARRKRHEKMSSTVVAAHIAPNDGTLHVAHVGDSRCYRVRAGGIELLTRDHSLRNEARISAPGVSEKQIAKLPKNAITRALGRKETVEIDVQSLPVLADDIYLLCSDGVNKMLPDARILEALQLADDPQEAAKLLIELANEAGGKDNITTVVLQFAHGRA
jgi:protein phosphatase